MPPAKENGEDPNGTPPSLALIRLRRDYSPQTIVVAVE